MTKDKLEKNSKKDTFGTYFTKKEARNLFLSTLSHELKNPLNSIIGFTQVLTTDSNHPLSNVQQQSLTNILKEGYHLLDMINAIIDFLIIESGELRIMLKYVELDSLMNEIISQTNSLSQQNDICFLYKTDHFNEFVKADPLRLKVILLNLLSNAVKYNRPGGEAGLACTLVNDDMIRIIVSDSGIGIPADQLDNVFEPFFRFNMETSDITGLGIGLSISKKMVELMDGRISVESEEGVGSKFFVDLPRVKKISGKSSIKNNILGIKKEVKKKILYIDHNKANITLIKSVLRRRSKIGLLSAMDAKKGINIALEESPQMIFLDINLPDKNGYDTIADIRKQETLSTIPIIAVNPDMDLNPIDRINRAGFDDNIKKPIDINEFLKKVDYFINNINH